MADGVLGAWTIVEVDPKSDLEYKISNAFRSIWVNEDSLDEHNCANCGNTGIVEMGEYDDHYQKKCLCQL